MAAKTTVKVSLTNNAAKDDYFTSSSYDWLSEDGGLSGYLNVLGNDPGSASLIGVSSELPLTSADLTATSDTSVDGIFFAVENGQIFIDASVLDSASGSLAEGEVKVITFFYTARMANGTYSTAKVTVEVTGSNDGPTLDATQAVIHDTSAYDNPLDISGQLAGHDVDTGAVLTYALGAGEDGLSAFGALTVNADGSWSFDADEAAINALKGQQVLTFDVKVTDEFGATGTSTIQITLEGANDDASITGLATGSVTEDSGSYVIGDTLTVNDVDTGDASFQPVAPASLQGTYGSFTFNEATGAWTYTLNNNAAVVAALNDGDVRHDMLTVTSLDGTDTQVIDVTINGHTDAAPFVYVTPAVYTGTGDTNDNDNAPVTVNQTGTYTGSTGADTIYGGAGSDKINGGNGNDTIFGGSGDDQIQGNNDNDWLYGGSGNDTINGGGGLDHLIGGWGADILTGSGAADTYVYLDVKDTGDTITDFSTAEGDKINLDALYGGTFAFDGAIAQAGAVAQGHVGYMTVAGVTTVYVGVDATYGADLEIKLSNGVGLASTDFIL